MSSPRPLETGWLADTPVDDNVVRQFVCNQGELNAAIAQASGGRVERSDSVLLADAGGSLPYYNQAVLSCPLGGENDPVLGEIDAFYRQAGDRPVTLLSMWPTPDLTPRGWMLVGHPAFVVRGPFPFSHEPAKGVEVREVRSPEELAVTERIAIEGYPMEEAAGQPVGTVMAPALLDEPVLFRNGLLDGVPVATAGSHVSHGVVNLCLAATLPAARRRGVWGALVWARLSDAPNLPAVAYTSDFSRPGFLRMGFLPMMRFTLWARSGNA